MKGRIKIVAVLLLVFNCAAAQEGLTEEERGGFQKDHLFTGGSISLGISNNSFQVGANPFFGYNVAKWLDAGLVVNYNYASYRDIFIVDPRDKIRSSTYGGGAFARIYPLRFLFAHVQFEHNFIREKLIPGNGGERQTNNVEANSLLIGPGVATERYAGDGRPFFYLSLLFDVLDQEFSPYSRAGGGIGAVWRAGIQVPLFQGSRRR
jgi:hypothetical protein